MQTSKKTQSLMLAFVIGLFGLIAVPASASIRATTPVTVRIPSIKVNAQIEARGLNAQGLMQGPTLPSRVAWDRTGVIPGQPGEAVMYGHLTDNHFQPAVFSRLNYVPIGGRVVVTDSRGTVRTFKVTKKLAIRADRITYFDISRDSKYIHLNLYTCAGRWDSRLRHYTHYLVVYTTLISSTPKK